MLDLPVQLALATPPTAGIAFIGWQVVGRLTQAQADRDEIREAIDETVRELARAHQAMSDAQAIAGRNRTMAAIETNRKEALMSGARPLNAPPPPRSHATPPGVPRPHPAPVLARYEPVYEMGSDEPVAVPEAPTVPPEVAAGEDLIRRSISLISAAGIDARAAHGRGLSEQERTSKEFRRVFVGLYGRKNWKLLAEK